MKTNVKKNSKNNAYFCSVLFLLPSLDKYSCNNFNFKICNIMKIKLQNLIIALILTSFTINTYSQESSKRIYNAMYTKTPPLIDGLLNDEVWDLVEWSGDFIQYDPNENQPPSQQTAFKILYDDHNIYVFIRAYDSEPDKISSIMSRRDDLKGDWVFIEFDSYFDKQTTFGFVAMASGAKGDEITSRDSWDNNWNPVWFLKTSIDDEGWCAEMQIPLSQLRFGNKEEMVWGLQVHRLIYRLQERSIWQATAKGAPDRINLLGELHGIKNIKPKRQIELMPYTLGKIERFEKAEGDPFKTGKLSALSVGLDGKIGLTNDFTLDFTINPDFGQVEADPSEVNLTAFETFYSEKRQFFIEGSNIYQFRPNQTITIHNMGSDRLFYSRRMGRFPQYSPSLEDNEYIKMPNATRILGALKVSGKTKNGLSVGVLESVTAKEVATIEKDGVRRNETVEPLTNYFVGRVQQDFNKGVTTLGGIVTAVNRNIDTEALNFLNKGAYAAGIDFKHSWHQREWYVAGNAEISNITGSNEAMISAQRSSARYFQRVDAKSFSVDSSATSLTGYGSTVKLGRTSQKLIQFETSLTARSPKLEFNDIGYMRSSDIIHHAVWVAFNVNNPFAIFNNLYINTNHWAYWNFDGDFLSSNININYHTQFKNLWRIDGEVNRTDQRIETGMLRGGPKMTMPGVQSSYLSMATNYSKKLIYEMGGSVGVGNANSQNWHDYWFNIYYRPTNALSLSIGPGYSYSKNTMQYISKQTVNNNPIYLFGEIQQKTVGITFRADYTINPELSIQYYAQPFISAGKYINIKHITDPMADKFSNRFHIFDNNEITYDLLDNNYNIDINGNGVNDFSISNPDFNFKQVRSNLVVRWEYRPGSTLYFVWSQGRTGSSSKGDFSYGNDLKDLYKITPHNVFLVKLSYWFAL